LTDVSQENNIHDFASWYREKMKDITFVMDELINETKIRSQNESIENFIKCKSDE
jgi:hypothetical protein